MCAVLHTLCLPFALLSLSLPLNAWLIISIGHNNESNNNYNRNYALSISKFNKWLESTSRKR